jgi:multimeric flavodoxin WrbA
MKLVILNGNKEAGNFDEKLRHWADKYPSENYEVEILALRELDINYCTGCWGCWVKHPGSVFSKTILLWSAKK